MYIERGPHSGKIVSEWVEFYVPLNTKLYRVEFYVPLNTKLYPLTHSLTILPLCGPRSIYIVTV